MRAELRRREARFIAVKQIKDVKEQIQELKGERIWAEVIENEKVCDWDSSPRHITLMASFVIILTTFWNERIEWKGGGLTELFYSYGQGVGRLCSFQQLRNKVSPLLMKEHWLLVLGFPRWGGGGWGGGELQVLALGLALVFFYLFLDSCCSLVSICCGLLCIHKIGLV